jgi:hypothetical protein
MHNHDALVAGEMRSRQIRRRIAASAGAAVLSGGLVIALAPTAERRPIGVSEGYDTVTAIQAEVLWGVLGLISLFC